MTQVTEIRRAVRDVEPLVRFRLAGLRGRGRSVAWTAVVAVAVLTAAVAVLPAYAPGNQTSARAGDLLLLLPSAYLLFLLATAFATIGAAGGRELLPRSQAVAFPVSPTTDHLGALLLAPLNIAWMLQAWSLLGVTAYVAGPGHLYAVQLTTVLWLVTATAVAQVVAWGVEWVRRTDHGVLIVRAAGLTLGLGAVWLVAAGSVTAVLDRSPTIAVVVSGLLGGAGEWVAWLWRTVLLAVVAVVAVGAGAVVAHAVAGRAPREEATAEGRTVSSRPHPRSELFALMRTDRASVWRSVPLRRGFFIVALMPGLVAAGGQLEWEMLPILPGLVAAGGALLFGVNAWCLDGIGALWRDSLPVDPRLVFVSRMLVLLEVLVGACGATLLIAGARAGSVPSAAELAAVVAAGLVVSLQVVARSMQWSVRRPYAMDLRSARGTPAPPSAMVGYSAQLALTSTLTGLVFGLTARASGPGPAIALATPLVLLALYRLVVTAREWATPDVRARVVATVAAS